MVCFTFAESPACFRKPMLYPAELRGQDVRNLSNTC